MRALRLHQHQRRRLTSVEAERVEQRAKPRRWNTSHVHQPAPSNGNLRRKQKRAVADDLGPDVAGDEQCAEIGEQIQTAQLIE